MNEDTPHSEIMKGLGKLEGLYTGIISRLDYANGRTGKLEARFDLLKDTVDKNVNEISNLKKTNTASGETKKEISKWAWGLAQNLIYAVIGALLFLAGLVLQNLHILNLTPQK